MTILYFTATGNCLAVAKSFGGVLKSIPQLERGGEYVIEDDAIGIVVPIYSLGLPVVVSKYLSHATLKADYIFAVLTYGMFSGAAADVLQSQLAARGNPLHYAQYLIMTDNYLPNFDMDAQLQGLDKKNVPENLAKILRDVNSRKQFIAKQNFLVSGITKLMSRMKASKDGQLAIRETDKKFSVNQKCNSCATCARVCPVNNIKLEPKPVFKHNCESCFACIHNCPTGAIQLAGQKSEARFRNKDVSLKEIIEANQDRR